MPKNKHFKARIRARMKKTGESYTTARAHILRGQSPPAGGATTIDPDSPDGFARLDPSQRRELLEWIRLHLKRAPENREPFGKLTSYGLKHVFEQWGRIRRDRQLDYAYAGPGFYVTNGAFKGAMREAGHWPIDSSEQNWRFRVEERRRRHRPAAFSAWLWQQRDREDAVGDLARDSFEDDDWPGVAEDYDTFRDYLAPYSTLVYAALREAWAEWQATLGGPDGGDSPVGSGQPPLEESDAVGDSPNSVEFNIREFNEVYERGPAEPAFPVRGRINGDRFCLEVFGSTVELVTVRVGMDERGPFAVVQAMETEFGDGLRLRVEPEYDEEDLGSAGMRISIGWGGSPLRRAQQALRDRGVDAEQVNVLARPDEFSLFLHFGHLGILDGQGSIGSPGEMGERLH